MTKENKCVSCGDVIPEGRQICHRCDNSAPKQKPLRKASMQTIKRFPELYKRQAMQVIDYERSEAIRITADSFVMASLLVLVEEFDFGTREDSTRIKRFVAKLNEKIDTSSDFYEDAIAEGLHNKLRAYGVEYKMR